MAELVERLARGDHPVVFPARSDDPLAELKTAIDRDYVHVKFTGTRGGTELGLRLDPQRSDLSGADFARGTGKVKVAGTLTLDGVPVRCVAELDLASFSGRGHLEILGDPP